MSKKVIPLDLKPTTEATIVGFGRHVKAKELSRAAETRAWRRLASTHDLLPVVQGYLERVKRDGLDDDDFEGHALYQKLYTMLTSEGRGSTKRRRKRRRSKKTRRGRRRRIRV